ncbi:MAG: helix-turn-helix transcriptional regulator [Clostridia bacterium]|nr:helix-turn-helix transcriptional regulator [Clostridia bacterium]
MDDVEIGELTKMDGLLEEQLKNPDFKAGYDTLEPEFILKRTMIEARISTGLTQKELSERTGIAQADISRIENGCANPSLRTLQRLAEAMGKTLQIHFV